MYNEKRNIIVLKTTFGIWIDILFLQPNQYINIVIKIK